jgi:hypothetical protein
MKKRMFLCALLVLSVAGHAAEQQVYVEPDCSKGSGKNEIISVVHTALTASLEDIKEKDVLDKQKAYTREFDLDNTSLTFSVKRLASEKMSNDDIFNRLVKFAYDKKYPEDIKPGGMLYERYMNKPIYKQYYEVKNNHGAMVISERYAVPLSGNTLECSDIGRVFIVSGVY